MKRAIIIAAGLSAAGLAGAQMFAQLFGTSSRLPAGYRECDYLESSGTQYINTAVVIGPSSTVEYVSSVLTGSASGTSMGYYDAANPIMNLGPITTHALRMLDTTTSPTVNVGHNNAFTALFDPFNGLLGINGANNTFSSAGKTFPNKPFYLLSRQGALTGPKARAYSFKHLESGILVKHLVPALDPAGVPCMFDLVTSAPLYNAGTGTFAYKLKE